MFETSVSPSSRLSPLPQRLEAGEPSPSQGSPYVKRLFGKSNPRPERSLPNFPIEEVEKVGFGTLINKKKTSLGKPLKAVKKILRSRSQSLSPTSCQASEEMDLTEQFKIAIGFQEHCPLKNICPPTPSSRSNSDKRNSSAFRQTFMSAENGSLKINNVNYNLGEPIGEGTFMRVYEVLGNEMVAKVFKDGKLKFNDIVMVACMKNAITNYKAAKKIGLPVSKIYNIETALADKCFLVELIPEEVSLTNRNHLDQMRHFFEMSYEHKIPFDLALSNFRVKLNNTDEIVRLVDFTEERLEFENSDEFSLFAIQIAKSYAQAVANLTANSDLSIAMKRLFAEKFLNELTHSLKGYNPEWNQEALNQVF